MSKRTPKPSRRDALHALGATLAAGLGLASPATSFARDYPAPSGHAPGNRSGGRLEGGRLDASWPPPRDLEILVPEARGGHAERLCEALQLPLKAAFVTPPAMQYRGDVPTAKVLADAVRAPADGASLCFVDQRALVLDPLLSRTGGFSVADLVPVTWVASRPYVVCTNRKVIARGLKDWLALAVERPGVMTFGSGGRGSVGHLAGEALRQRAGVDVLHVPYANERAAIVAAIANEVQAVLLDPVTAAPEIRAGRLRALAVTSGERLEALHDVPTVAEQGLGGFEVVRWAGLAMPRGVTPTVVAKMHAVIGRAVSDHDVVHALEKAMWQPVGEGPQAFAAMIRAEAERWATIVRQLELRAA